MLLKRVLVLCTGNSARSQMAHGYLQKFLGAAWEVSSAGTRPQGVNPLAVLVMAEDGVDISHHRSTSVDEYRDGEFSLVLTVCDNAREECPYFPGARHRSFEDPGQDADSFRRVRDQIKVYAQEIADELAHH